MALPSSRPTFQLLSTLSRSGATTQFRQFYVRASAASSPPLFSNEVPSRQSSKASKPSPEEPRKSTNSTMSYYGSYTIGTYRPFHSSPLTQATGDSSTIDYMKFPEFDPDLEEEDLPRRVPLLPDFALHSYAADEQAAETFEPVEIITASGVPAHTPMPAVLSDMQSADTVDYEGVAAVLVQEASKAQGEEVGTFSRVLKDMIDDLLGSSEKPSRS